MQEVKVNDKIIGDGHPTFIIVEMAWSHDGSIDKAKRIIDIAANAKADAVNIHITSMNDYMVPQYSAGIGKSSSTTNTKPLFEYLSQINLTPKDLEILIPYAKSKGLLVSVLCNDIPSAQFVSKLEPDLYSLHASCISEESLIKKIAHNHKPVILNVGGCTIAEIERAVSWIRGVGNLDICLLFGIQTYPTSIENAKIGYIKTLQNIFGLPVGMADHTDGGSELALVVPIAGVVSGSNLIEKHVTHDRSLKGEDYEAALDEKKIVKLIEWIRKIEIGLKDPHVDQLSDDELLYRSVSMKKLVAATDIMKGEKIDENKIAAKRSDEGLEVYQMNFIVGRIANQNIKKNEGITFEKVV